MPDTAYLRILRDLSSFFDTEKTGAVPFRHEGYSLEPLRNYLGSKGALRPAEHVLHVGGTKGKGSVTTLCGAILQAHGMRVGSYLSPHLVSYRERIRIQGCAVEEASFAAALGRVLAEKPDPGGSPIRSVFEALTAAAALLFRSEGLEAAVLEVGLGGRLDATNVLETSVSVLTPVSLDHMEVLGDTVRAIAGDKAGILRPGNPAVIGPQSAESLEVLLDRARQCGARPQVYGRDFWVETEAAGFAAVFSDGLRIDGLRPAMAGAYQRQNAAVALAAVRAALGELDPAKSREAVATARMAGRMQELLLEDGGRVVLDGAHNPFAAETLAEECRTLYGTPLAVLAGISSNKDAAGILRPLLPLADPLLCASFGGPRSLEAGRLGELAHKLGARRVEVFPTVEEAWTHWLGMRSERPILLATGSLFLVGKLLRVLHAEGRIALDPPPDPEV